MAGNKMKTEFPAAKRNENGAEYFESGWEYNSFRLSMSFCLDRKTALLNKAEDGLLLKIENSVRNFILKTLIHCAN